MKGDLYTGRMRGFQIRPLNCDKGTKERCPNCNQFHLRPGYCQALDPQKTAIDAGKDAWIKRRAAELRAFYANIDNEELVPDNISVPDNLESVPDSIEYVPVNYCTECGEGFEAKRKDARFCSERCRKRNQRAKPEDVS